MLSTILHNRRQVDEHLLSEEGEQVVDVVTKHGVAYMRPACWAVAGFAVWIVALFVPMSVAWVFLLGGFCLMGKGALDAMGTLNDVFVITNMRVFRLSGVFTVKIATMPITRILDITVHKPLVGRILGYGHFVFESAAQAQGLREIHYIPRPDERDLTIQRVVQRAGVRGRIQLP